MSLTKVSYSMISGEVINATDYAVVGDGVADDTAAIQAAITAATTAKKILRLPAGTYKITASLTLSGTNWLVGDGKDSTRINYTGASSAIICSTWGGRIQGLSVYVSNSTASAIQVGTNSRNCSIDAVYLDATAVGSTTTGAGFYLNAGTGFSGGITISNSYALQFKYGVKMVGTNLSTGTWTSVCMYNLWLVGYASGIIAGSAGVYMDALTNGIGTSLYGGTIESMYYGIYVADDSYGGVFETDLEGNTNDYSIGNAFQGHVTSAFGVPYIQRSSNTPSQIWELKTLIGGEGPKQENTYPPSWLVYNGSSQFRSINYYRNDVSVINGGSLEPNALKFSFGMGFTGAYGLEVHPNQHYLQIDDRTIHWDSQSPATTGGKAWVKGSVCYNFNATVGQPTGWMCTVSGTPGTWVAMANL